MPPTLSSAAVTDQALGLVWGLWRELGLSGWVGNPTSTGIDLEPLIIATASLGSSDPRLLEEAFDWCLANSKLISSVRLRNLLPTFDLPTQKAFGDFAATVKRHKKVAWPADGSPLRLQVTGRSSAPELTRPTLQQLRLRAVFGVSARAEILWTMLQQPSRFYVIGELALTTAYGKDNIADALELLSMAGVVTRTTMTTTGSRRTYRLDAVSALEELVGQALPTPDWGARFRLVLALIRLFAEAPGSETGRAAAIVSFVEAAQQDLRRVATFPHLRRGVDSVNEDFDRWMVGALKTWANLPNSG